MRPPLEAELPEPEEVEPGGPRADQENLQGDQAEQAQPAVHGAGGPEGEPQVLRDRQGANG